MPLHHRGNCVEECIHLGLFIVCQQCQSCIFLGSHHSQTLSTWWHCTTLWSLFKRGMFGLIDFVKHAMICLFLYINHSSYSSLQEHVPPIYLKSLTRFFSLKRKKNSSVRWQTAEALNTTFALLELVLFLHFLWHTHPPRPQESPSWNTYLS